MTGFGNDETLPAGMERPMKSGVVLRRTVGAGGLSPLLVAVSGTMPPETFIPPPGLQLADARRQPRPAMEVAA